MPECLRCGKCCYLNNNGVQFSKCKYLLILKNGKTLCRIYKNRLGVEIAKGHFCTLRENVTYNFLGCPYNKEGNIFIQEMPNK